MSGMRSAISFIDAIRGSGVFLAAKSWAFVWKLMATASGICPMPDREDESAVCNDTPRGTSQ